MPLLLSSVVGFCSQALAIAALPCRRRDLEAARTLADQVRKREKLKRRELQLYKEEWAARMQGEWAAGLAGQL